VHDGVALVLFVLPIKEIRHYRDAENGVNQMKIELEELLFPVAVST